MIELFLALLIVPTVTIAAWDHLVHRLSVNARRAYRLTGFVGVPIHELAHASVCILFGMRIKKISFYKPNSASGTMGFVDFRYSPLSLRHAIGLAVQGLAPLLAGAALVAILLDSFELATPPGAGAMAVCIWIAQVAGTTLNAAVETALSGPWGTAALMLAMVISMHSIPSAADMRLGIRGLVMLVVAIGAAVMVFDLPWLLDSAFGLGLGSLVGQAEYQIEKGLWLATYAAVSMVTMSVLGGITLIVLPAAVGYCIEFVRGARGEI